MVKLHRLKTTKIRSFSWPHLSQFSRIKSVGSSMLPLFGPNSNIHIKKSSNYEVNDIVVFRKDRLLIAHRIIHIPKSRRYVVTKGDNNIKSDGIIPISSILGKIDYILENNQKKFINNIYLARSSLYMHHIKQFVGFLNKNRLPYVLIKGMPLHLYYEGKLPRRIYFDVDFLIEERNLSKIIRYFSKVGFQLVKDSASKSKIKPLQLSFIKTDDPFGVNFDIHINPVRIYRRLSFLNIFVPNQKKISELLWSGRRRVKINNIFLYVLKRETLIVYLLLHYFQHNFKGIHRLDFVNNIANTNPKPDWIKIAHIMHKYSLYSLCLPPLYILRKYFDFVIPAEFEKNVKINPYTKLVSFLISKYSDPFSSDGKIRSLVRRIFYSIICSPIFS